MNLESRECGAGNLPVSKVYLALNPRPCCSPPLNIMTSRGPSDVTESFVISAGVPPGPEVYILFNRSLSTPPQSS